MKKMRRLLILPLLVGCSISYGADGTINFVGNLTNAACSVDPSSTSAVELGTINMAQFTRNGAVAGNVASATKVSINLSGCPASITKATVRFDGRPYMADQRLLALNADQTATGLAIAIYEADGQTIIPLQTASFAQALSNTESLHKLVFIAKYISTGAAVAPGTANASTSFTVAYN